MIKLRTLIWEDFPGLSSGPNTVTGSPERWTGSHHIKMSLRKGGLGYTGLLF